MSGSPRLSLAFDQGLLRLPEQGRVGFWNMQPGHAVPDLPRDRVDAVQAFRPAHDALAGLGFRAMPEPSGPYAMAVVSAGRSRAATLGWLAAALAAVPPGGAVVLDGQKTDGIEGLLNTVRPVLGGGPPLAKAHGKLCVFERPANLPEAVAGWATAAHPRPGPDGLRRRPGGFSADGPDPGSAALAAVLPSRLQGVTADLGAGAGALSVAVLSRPGVTRLDLVEADFHALQDARDNIDDPRARFLWQDVTAWQPGPVYDVIVSNPPFHAGRRPDPALGVAFIRAAAAALVPGGRFWMVANRHLPYERPLSDVFRDVRQIAGGGGFKLFEAARPVAAGNRRSRKD